jgi:hypothetical protein
MTGFFFGKTVYVKIKHKQAGQCRGHRFRGQVSVQHSRGGNLIGWVGAVWGVAGVALLLGSAVYRMTPLALGAFSVPLGRLHWLSLAACILFMAYAEGVRGFQQRFSPRVAARARYLREHPEPLHVVFAPLFCMGFIHATARRMIASLSVTAGVIVLVLAVHRVPQPWRGIIDAGVVVGLAWGLVSLLWFAVAALTRTEFPYPPEVPGRADRS